MIFLLFSLSPYITILLSGFPASWNLHPCDLAALTNSILSGETQIYSSTPSSLTSTEHVWHKDNAVQKCSIKSFVFSKDNLIELSSLFII